MTQKEKQYCIRYNNSTIYTIYEAYEKPSNAKIDAYENIRVQMTVDGGYDFRILSYNNQFFSCAYKTEIDSNSLQGHTYFLKVFTPTKNLTIRI